MNKIFKFIAIGFLALTAAACSRVEPGNVGIWVHTMGDDRGVQKEVLAPGWYWAGPFKNLYTYPIFTITDEWRGDNSIKFQSVEGMQVSADVGITFTLEREKVPLLFEKYRLGVTEISATYLRNMVRDAIVQAASSMTVEEVYGKRKNELISTAQKTVEKLVSPYGIKIDKIYLTSEIRVPPAVGEALNRKIAAIQRAEQERNEIERTKAEAEKKIIAAKADADANKILSQSITSELITFRRLDLERQALDKWDGQLPKTMIPNSTVPFIGASVGGPGVTTMSPSSTTPR